jgi:uncharacterized membrane protein
MEKPRPVGRAWRVPLVFSLLAALGATSLPARAAESTAAAEKKNAAEPKESFNLILPFQDLTVGQGQEVTMDAEVVNRRKNPVQVNLSIEAVPKGWEVGFHSRYPSYPIRSVMVQGEKSTTIEFKAKVPEKVKAGDYQLRVSAKDEAGTTTQTETVRFRVTSKKVETGGLKLTSQYPVLSTPTGQTLKFTVDLKNETNKPLTVALAAQAPPGWVVRFKPQFGDTLISSIQARENATETLSVEIDSPVTADAGEYPVTIRARSGAFEASTELKVALKGTTDLRIGTLHGGTLNTTVTAGRRTTVDFAVGNAGTATIRNLSFVTKKPADNWVIEFKPEKIDALKPGEVREIKIEIQPPPRTIAGDYLLTFNPNSPDIANPKSVDFRVTVLTRTLWGLAGAGVLAFVVLGLGFVFFRLGRR